jgi:hypothetical protein
LLSVVPERYRAVMPTGAHPDAPADLGTRLRQAVSDAIGYWEPRRIAYNAVLALVVVTYFALNWPLSRTVVSFDSVFLLFVLAVLANICYCAAYLADIFIQLSGFRRMWQKWRWLLFVIGLAFAAIITRWFAIVIFTRPHAG